MKATKTFVWMALWLGLMGVVRAEEAETPETQATESETSTETGETEADRVVDQQGDMQWFYTKFGESTWYQQAEFTVDSFTTEEYQKLIDASKNGDATALGALKSTLFKHLKSHPNDAQYQALKTQLYAHDFMMSLPLEDEELVKYLPDSLGSDREFVLKLAQQNKDALAFADAGLRDDRAFVLQVVTANGLALSGALNKYKDDAEVVTAAINSPTGTNFGAVSKRLRGDRKTVLAAVTKLGTALEEASDGMKADKEVALTAVRSNSCAYQYVAPKLREDREVALAAFGGGRSDCSMQYLPASLKTDTEIMVIASHQMAEGQGGTESEKVNWDLFPTDMWTNRKFLFALAKSWNKHGCAFRYRIPPDLKTDKDFSGAMMRKNIECRWLK